MRLARQRLRKLEQRLGVTSELVIVCMIHEPLADDALRHVLEHHGVDTGRHRILFVLLPDLAGQMNPGELYLHSMTDTGTKETVNFKQEVISRPHPDHVPGEDPYRVEKPKDLKCYSFEEIKKLAADRRAPETDPTR
jgi:hypothetical protein